MFLLILALLCSHPQSPAPERVDVIELQEFWDWRLSDDKPPRLEFVFTQVVFRRWNERTLNHEIVAWWMQRNGKCEKRFPDPRYNHVREVWQVTNEHGVTVEAPTLHHWAGDFDIEAAERERWPSEKRQGLRKVVR